MLLDEEKVQVPEKEVQLAANGHGVPTTSVEESADHQMLIRRVRHHRRLKQIFSRNSR